MTLPPVNYTIQLVGGPDDGDTFITVDLPTFWEMLSENICDECFKKGYHTPLDSERYWRSNNKTAGGHHIYYHEGSLNLKAVMA